MAQLLLQNPLLFLLLIIPLLYSVILHEVSHGVVALAFGDDTAKRSGRLTLNPLPHLDLVGSIAIFLVGFGWAKPVPVDYSRLRHFRAGLVCVAGAGVVMNILLAIFASYLLRAGYADGQPMAAALLQITARINLMLAALNLIPIPPLDGSKILMGFLPHGQRIAYARLEPYGFVVLLALLFTGLLTPLILFMENLVLRLLSAAL